MENKTRFLLLTIIVLIFVLIGTTLLYDGESKAQPIVGFVITGNKDDQGWNGKHYEGMKSAADKIGAKLIVKENIEENAGQCPKAIEELAAKGAKMIFLTSYGYPKEAAEIAKKYPNIAFGTISAEYTEKNMTANFIRVYQGRYLSGIIAGMRTKSNKIGYVAAMRNSEVNRGINAFSLGVKRVNPNARIFVAFTNSWQDAKKEAANAKRLINAGADVITYHQNQKTVADTCEWMQVDFIGYHEAFKDYSSHSLTSVVCKWDAYYTDILQRYLKGELNKEEAHWIGVEKDAVYLSPYSDRVTEDMKKEVEKAKTEMLEGFLVFSGEIKDNEGNIRSKAGEAISDEVLLERVDWLEAGVTVIEE